MIKKEYRYSVKCAKCGRTLNCLMRSAEGAKLEAYDNDWVKIDDQFYCPNCVEFDVELDDYVVKKTEVKFNVILNDINRDVFEPYDIIPYLNDCYIKEENKPKTFAEFREFIIKEARYQWWARCQYEIILSDWPCNKVQKKVDVYWQIMLNIDLITKLFMSQYV